MPLLAGGTSDYVSVMKKTALLSSRSLLKLTGSDAIDFLQNLVTCDVETLATGQITFGALLTPQGKILFDFYLQRQSDCVLMDVDSTQLEALKMRLTFYKLRADVEIIPPDLQVYASWGDAICDGTVDPRNSALGHRIYAESMDTNALESDWNDHRLRLGIPASGTDFELGSLFPHDALMDQFELGGIDFSKGCYVGQEVVSRMQHRATARNRFVNVTSPSGTLAPAGTEITAAGKKIGTMGSSNAEHGLALVRIDRAAKAIENGDDFQLAKQKILLAPAAFTKFDWPT
ncbi:MAG: YgfZ/GcvT domain-containing protein [Rhizobiaceae bacterium]